MHEMATNLNIVDFSSWLPLGHYIIRTSIFYAVVHNLKMIPLQIQRAPRTVTNFPNSSFNFKTPFRKTSKWHGRGLISSAHHNMTRKLTNQALLCQWVTVDLPVVGARSVAKSSILTWQTCANMNSMAKPGRSKWQLQCYFMSPNPSKSSRASRTSVCRRPSSH